MASNTSDIQRFLKSYMKLKAMQFKQQEKNQANAEQQFIENSESLVHRFVKYCETHNKDLYKSILRMQDSDIQFNNELGNIENKINRIHQTYNNRLSLLNLFQRDSEAQQSFRMFLTEAGIDLEQLYCLENIQSQDPSRLNLKGFNYILETLPNVSLNNRHNM